MRSLVKKRHFFRAYFFSVALVFCQTFVIALSLEVACHVQGLECALQMEAGLLGSGCLESGSQIILF